MDVSPLSVAAYLLVGGFCGVWFWRLIRSAGHSANTALILVSTVFGLLWPIMMPGVTIYRWMLPRPVEARADAESPAGR
ncbi:MAG: hypothetical protein ACSLFA_08850 [Mycobacterium sp.]